MRVLILKPRMDVTFKEGPVPSQRGSIPAIRVHWLAFIDQIAAAHREWGDFIEVREKPLWQFHPSEVDGDVFDRVYVPHREAGTFPITDSRVKPMYYMQSVVPEKFYCDFKGWAGGVSDYPCSHLVERGERLLKMRDARALANLHEMTTRMHKNVSKFEQPSIDEPWHHDPGYIFFPCQLPHDETIRSHSNWSVDRALTAVLESAARIGAKVVMKGHPINPGSMIALKQEAYKYNHVTWVDHVSVHRLIAGSRVVACVNSGVGFEALIHDKPVVTFGRSDYDSVTMSVDRHGSSKLDEWLARPAPLKARAEFLAGWCDWMYDVRDKSCFSRLRRD